MPSTTSYRFGHVVLVPFPFTDQSAAKQRPAVVVSSAAVLRSSPDLIVMPLTSQVSRWRGETGAVEVVDPAASGLPKPSVVKPLLASLEKPLVRKVLGRADKQTREAIRAALRVIVG